MAAGIAAVAPHFVPVVFGNEWGPMVPLIQVLAIWGGIRAFGATVGPIYKSTGRPDIEVKIQATKVIIGSVSIFPVAEHFGVTGVATLLVCLPLLTNPIHQYILTIILETDIRTLLKPAVYPFIGSVLMYIAVTQVSGMISMNALSLILLIVVGIIIYALFMYVIDQLTDYNSIYLINSMFGSV